MLIVVFGTDKKSRDLTLETVISSYKKDYSGEVVVRDRLNFGNDAILEHAEQQSLFGVKPLLVVTDFSSDEESLCFWEENADRINSGVGRVVCVFETISKDLAKKLHTSGIATYEAKQKTVPSKPKNDTRIFALTDAFLKKDKKVSWQIFRDLIDTGREPREIVNTLFWALKTTALVDDAVAKNQTSVPGIHPFVFSKTKTVLNFWEKDELKQALHAIVDRYHEGQFSGKDFDQVLEQYLIEMK